MKLAEELTKIAGKVPISNAVLGNFNGLIERALGEHAAGEIGKAKKTLSDASAFARGNFPGHPSEAALTRSQKGSINTAKAGIQDYGMAFPEVGELFRSFRFR